jgi:hypothetical protein
LEQRLERSFRVETLNLGFTTPSPFGQNNHCGFFIGCYCIGPNPILKRIRDGTVDVPSNYFVCTYSPCSIGIGADRRHKGKVSVFCWNGNNNRRITNVVLIDLNVSAWRLGKHLD